MESDQNLSRLREILVKTLKRFSLTYEQHQLLHGPTVGLVVAQVQSKRKRITVVVATLAGLSWVLAMRSVINAELSTLWMVWGIIFSVWLVKRLTSSRTLERAFQAFVAAGGDVETTTGTLAEELHLRFKLQYDEHQAIKAGDANLAATKIIDRCRANTQNSITYGAGISGCGLLWAVFSSIPKWTNVITWLAATVIIALCVIAIAISDKATIAQVEKVLENASIAMNPHPMMKVRPALQATNRHAKSVWRSQSRQR